MRHLSIIPAHRHLPESTRSMRLAPAVLPIAAVLVSAVLSSPALGAAADRIWQKSGGRPIVADTVSQDDFDELKYKKGSVNLTLEGIKVRSVDYGDAPESYLMALDKRDEADFENAVALFKAAMAESGVRPWIRLHGAYEMGQTFRLWGGKDRSKFKDAITQFDAALAAGTKARIRPDILFGRARSHLGAGNVDKALADLDTLAQEAQSNKYGVSWELNALYEKAQALDEAGRADEAKREYSRLQTQARSFAGMSGLDAPDKKLATEMAGLARLAQGRVLIRNGKPADAERFFEEIVKDDKEVGGVRAAALVGQAEALIAQKKLKDAQLALASVRIRYYKTDAVAEATYRLGLVAEELGSSEPRGSKLAQSYFLEVAQRYSGSRWAQKAQEKLN